MRGHSKSLFVPSPVGEVFYDAIDPEPSRASYRSFSRRSGLHLLSSFGSGMEQGDCCVIYGCKQGAVTRYHCMNHHMDTRVFHDGLDDIPHVEALKLLVEDLEDMAGDEEDEALRLACSAFLSSESVGDALFVYEIERKAVKSPITDFSVKWRKDKVPDGYRVLKRSFAGDKADLNKGAGGKYIYICFRRAHEEKEEEEIPITGLAVTVSSHNEEAPLGFGKVAKTISGNDASLSFGVHSGYDIYLCTERGSGPPITDIGLLFLKNSKHAPPCYYRLKHTPRGRSANLNFGSEGRPAFLCFTLDTVPSILKYAEFLDNEEMEHLDVIAVALAAAGILSTKQIVVDSSLYILRRLLVSALCADISADLFNWTLKLLCECVPIYSSVFDEEVTKKLHHLIRDLFIMNFNLLSPIGTMHVVRACFFLRSADRNDRIMDSLVNFACLKLPQDIISEDSLGDHFDPDEKHESEIILQDMVEWISLVKSTEDDIAEFHRNEFTEFPLLVHIGNSLISEFSPNYQPSSVCAAMFITLSKILAETSSEVSTYPTETIKRKSYALRLVQRLLEHGTAFFDRNAFGGLALRRIFFPSFLPCFVCVYPEVFQSSLETMLIIWRCHREVCRNEMCVLVDTLLLGLLNNEWTLENQKVDLLEGISMLFQTSNAVVDFYYNFDYIFYEWRVFEHLVVALSRIACGTDLDLLNPDEVSLQVTGFSALVNIMERISVALLRLLGVMGTRFKNLQPIELLVDDPGSSTPRRLLSRYEDEESKLFESSRDKISIDIVPEDTDEKVDEFPTIDFLDFDPLIQKPRSRRTLTFDRYTQQQHAQAIEKEALEIAVESESVKKGVQHIVFHSAQFDADRIARFLKNNDDMDKADVGAFLGTESNKFMSTEQFINLRRSYVSLLDFSGMDFVSALRLYLTGGGFRLAGESQKISRVLEAFADQYFRDNPSVFPVAETTFLVCYSTIMLNVDLHNPNLVNNRVRPPMSMDDFIRAISNLDRGDEIDPKMAETIYKSIEAEEIQWQDPKSVSARVATLKKLNPEDRLAFIQKSFLKDSQAILRSALAFLKDQAPYRRKYYQCSSSLVVDRMFQLSCGMFVSSINAMASRTQDAEVLTLCLEAIKFGGTTAIFLRLPTDALIYADLLARIHYSASYEGTNEQLQKDLISKVHNDEIWYQDFRELLNDGDTKQSCRLLNRTANRIEQTLLYKRDQSVLMQYHGLFDGTLNLLHPDRRFIRAQDLEKLSTKKNIQNYRFFLFSDLLIYASPRGKKYKVHRVIHLSLCRLLDLKDRRKNTVELNHCLQIKNPQKSLIVKFPTQQDKVSWSQDLKKAIEKALKLQRKWIEQAENQIFEPSYTFSGSYAVDLLDSKTASVILGMDEEMGICRLCVRKFTKVKRRRYGCPYCQRKVCSDCSQKSAKLIDLEGVPTGETQKVCDVCHGILTGLVKLNTPILRRED